MVCDNRVDGNIEIPSGGTPQDVHVFNMAGTFEKSNEPIHALHTGTVVLALPEAVVGVAEAAHSTLPSPRLWPISRKIARVFGWSSMALAKSPR